jgi:hypothetical protein
LHNTEGGKSDYGHEGNESGSHKQKNISRDKHQTAVKKLRFSWQSRNAISYATFYSRSHNAVIRVYDATGNVIETHEHVGDFKEA